MKSFIKKHINTTYEGRIDTSEEFSLGLDYAQVYVSLGQKSNILRSKYISKHSMPMAKTDAASVSRRYSPVRDQIYLLIIASIYGIFTPIGG